MENFSGIKELYDVSIRLNNPVEIGKKKYDINEAILTFKTAEIAQVTEKKRDIMARGGYNNNPLVYWEVDKEVGFSMTHGVLSPTSWAVLSNSQIKNPQFKSVSYNEMLHTIEDDKYCYIELKYCPNAIDGIIGAQPNPNFEPLPMGRRPELMLKPLPPSKKRWIFCYEGETGLPIREFQIYGNKIFFQKPYREVFVDYTFTYEDKIKVLEVGNRLLGGFLRLDGKMSVKDEKSGEVTTAILELPKIKLSSSLSMRLGKNYENSTVSDFFFTGYPEDEKKYGTVARVTFLDKELTGDYI